MPILTQSAGVPETENPLKPLSRSISFTYKGLAIVIACPTALFCVFGATIVTSPNSFATSHNAYIPVEYIPSSFVTNIFNLIYLLSDEVYLSFHFLSQSDQ